MPSSVLPLNPCGLVGEVVPILEIRFVGFHHAVMHRNGRSFGSRRIWTGRYHPG